MLPQDRAAPHPMRFDASEGAAMRRDLLKLMLLVIGIPVLCTLALRFFVAPWIN